MPGGAGNAIKIKVVIKQSVNIDWLFSNNKIFFGPPTNNKFYDAKV